MDRLQKISIANDLAAYGEAILREAKLNPEKRLTSDPSKLRVSVLREEMVQRWELVHALGQWREIDQSLDRLSACIRDLDSFQSGEKSAKRFAELNPEI